MLNAIVLVLCVCFVTKTKAQLSHGSIEYLLPPRCRPSRYNEPDAPSCPAVAAQAVSVSSGLYGPPGIHYTVMGSSYYMARLALALGARCPTSNNEWDEMQLTTPWNGEDGAVALDSGFAFKKVIRRECLFPTTKYPFLCQGAAGTPGTYGASLGWLSNIPVLTDNVNWCLFVQCWDPDRPGVTGTNYARSWNVFSKQKTLAPADQAAIVAKIEALGFDPQEAYAGSFDNPALNPTCPA